MNWTTERTNIVMLVLLSYASHIFDVAYMMGASIISLQKKGKNNPKNGVCFDRGVEAAKNKWNDP